jgi:hypothetical protein
MQFENPTVVFCNIDILYSIISWVYSIMQFHLLKLHNLKSSKKHFETQ